MFPRERTLSVRAKTERPCYMLKLSDELVSALSRSDGLKMMVGLDPDDPQNNVR